MEVIGFVLSILAGLLILVFLVAIHEFGHGIVARRNGVVVEEFGVGFPPRAWGRKLKQSILGKNVLYSVNWLPIGGFVKLRGEYDAASKPGDYGAATFWQKTKIILAGVATNWIAAAVLFSVLALVGMPKLIPNQFYVASDARVDKSVVRVGEVVEGLPAEKAGLQEGDVLESVTPLAMICPASIDVECEFPVADEVGTIVSLAQDFPGETLVVTYIRDGETRETKLANRTSEEAVDGKGYMGISLAQDKPTTIQSTWSAPVVGVGVTGQLSWEILKGIGGLLQNVWTGIVGNLTGDRVASQKLGEAGDSVAGPVGIVGQILPGAVSAGIVPVLLITAILSVTLAVMNILPIPALDGGRWYLMALFKVMNKPLTKEIEERINGYGMIFLLGLIALITVLDVGRLF